MPDATTPSAPSEDGVPQPSDRDLVALFLDEGPVPAAVAMAGRIVRVNQPFARALGRERDACRGSRVAELLPAEDGVPILPSPGGASSYRTRLDGVVAWVDVSAERGDRGLVAITLRPVLDDPDTARTRALVALSRELTAALDEEDLSAALARALDALFPGRD